MRQVATGRAVAVLAASLAWTAAAGAQQRAIDPEKSVLTVRVSKAGLLSGFGHDHKIAAPITGGSVDTTSHEVKLHAKSGALRVSDPDTSDKDRAEIQKTMLGPQVLDVERHPEIVFRSTGAESTGDGAWKVRGNLTLHGQTVAVVADVKETGGHYVGTSRFKQTSFGIKPVKVAGGTIRVKDEVRIEFDIQLAH